MGEETIIFDIGSYKCKAGYSGEVAPRSIFRTVVGKKKGSYHGNLPFFVGDEALEQKYPLKYPIENGIITGWDEVEQILIYTFNHLLKINPENHSMLMTGDLYQPKANYEKLKQVIFECFKVPKLFIANQALLPLIASGSNTGLVVDIGDSICRTIPIYEGFIIKDAISSLNFSGKDLNKYFMKMINERGYTEIGNEIVRDIKEKHGYISLNYEDEMKSQQLEKMYSLPDGQVVTLGNELFRCPEALFQPSVLEKESVGIHEAIYNSLMQCQSEVSNEMIKNIILSGGSTLFPGFPERIKKELENLMPGRNIHVIAPPSRKISAWQGGSILSMLPTFQNNMWTNLQDYEESPFYFNNFYPSFNNWYV